MKHILLVDDNTTNLRMAASVLQNTYELSMAKSGKQALNFLKKNKPDLILLDLLMPEMDGYETMEEIKLNPATQDIPIIFLTADNQRESEIKGLQLGALDFITKPFEEDVMLSRIEKVLMMDDMRRKLFDGTDKDSSTGLYNFDYLKNKISDHLSSDHGGALLLLSIDNMVDLRENVQSRSFASYMSYFYETLSKEREPASLACKITDDEYLIAVTDSIDIYELNEAMLHIYEYLSKEIELEDEEGSMTVQISIGSALCVGSGDFDTFYTRADKALYHVMNTDELNFHIYKGK